MLVTGFFVFCLEEPVIQVLKNPDATILSHEFDLLYHYGKLHRSHGEAEWQGSELESLILIMKPQILSGVLAYRDMKVSIAEI